MAQHWLDNSTANSCLVFLPDNKSTSSSNFWNCLGCSYQNYVEISILFLVHLQVCFFRKELYDTFRYCTVLFMVVYFPRDGMGK